MDKRNLLLEAFLSDQVTPEAKQLLFSESKGIPAFSLPQAPTKESIFADLNAGHDSLRPVSLAESKGIPDFLNFASYLTPLVGDIRSAYDAGESANYTKDQLTQGN